MNLSFSDLLMAFNHGVLTFKELRRLSGIEEALTSKTVGPTVAYQKAVESMLALQEEEYPGLKTQIVCRAPQQPLQE